MSEELRNLIVETQEAFRTNPAEAKATFESASSLGEGFRSEVALRDHRLVVDEPESLGGTDTGPNPVELILAALGTCQEITYRAYAAALGIPLEHVAVTLEGDIDLRGFFAVDESVRPGYQKLRGTVRVVSSADHETLEKLQQAVDESVRPGYQKLRGTVRVVSSADHETLEKLQQAVNAHCPVLDIISNPVPVELTLEKTESAVAEAAE